MFQVDECICSGTNNYTDPKNGVLVDVDEYVYLGTDNLMDPKNGVISGSFAFYSRPHKRHAQKFYNWKVSCSRVP